MAVKLKSISVTDDYLHCSFEGRFEKLAKMEENTKKVLAAHEESGFFKALLDFSQIKGTVGLLYEHYLGKQISFAAPQNAKIALLGPKHLKIFDTGHLRNVTANRATNLKIFWDMNEAVAWLNSAE